MPYDGTVEIDEFRYMDTRDRPERDYRERDPPNRPPNPQSNPRPTGPSPWDIIQMAQADAQRAAYLATNPDPITGLPRIRNPLADIVNNPAVTVTAAEVKAINDPKKMMTPQGKIVKRVQRAPLYPPIKEKRTRKKTKTDRTMSSCLKQANARGKLKNGKFRKGWNQSRIMTYAHKLCRKEMGTRKGMVRKTARRAYEK